MNKLSYVNTKHYKNLVFLLLQYHLIITILTSEFPQLTYNARYTHLIDAISTKKQVPIELKIIFYCIWRVLQMHL